MTPRQHFEVLIRAAGLAIFLFSLPRLVSLGYTVFAVLDFMDSTDQTRIILGCVATLFQFVLGIYLLRGGYRFVRFIYPIDGTVCARCGWDLTTVTTAECPDCGASVSTNSKPVTR